MVLFIAGILVAWFIEWVVFSFWWKPKQGQSKDVVVMTASEVEHCEDERDSLKNSVLDKDREISHLHARVAMLEEATDRVAREHAATGGRPAEPSASGSKPAAVKDEKKSDSSTESVKGTAVATKKKAVAKKPKAAPAPKKATPKKASQVKKKAASQKPAATNDKAADLRQMAKLKGVGPKLAELLAESGLDSIQKVIDASDADLKAALVKAGGRYANLDASSWAEQGKLISAGDNAGLKKLQASLK